VVVHFSERIEVPLAAADVWSFVWQIDRTAACLPGCVGVTEVEAGARYTARIQDRVGPFAVAFDLHVAVEEAIPPRRIRLRANSDDSGLGVSQRIGMTVDLQETAASRTRLNVEADVEVEGKVVALGQFMVQRKAAEIVKKFAQNLDKALRQDQQQREAQRA
jgi:carbon monoxide dehydrogenase subunit G